MITHYIILIDASHSMNDKIKNIIFSLNNYISSKKNNHDIYFTITYFNNELYCLKKMENVNNIINPISVHDLIFFGGLTALYDSICEIINEFSTIIDKNVHHNFFIITDGDDNLSRKYDKNETEILCNRSIKSGLWTILHFHTHDIESLFNISEEIEINNDNLENIFSNLKI